MRKILLCSICFWVLTIFLAVSAEAELCFVQKVVDGRTLQLMDGEQVRLIGLDIPQERMEETTQLVRELVSGAVVSLEYDVEQRDKDGYLQGYIWFEYEGQGEGTSFDIPEGYEARYVIDEEGKGTGMILVMLNATIIKSGLATPTDIQPNVKYSELHNQLYQDRLAKQKTDVLANLPADLVVTEP